MRVHLFELLGSSERKWGVAGVWKIYPVELQERARLHFPYTTYYHVESVLQKRLKRQDHLLLIVSISIYNTTLIQAAHDKTRKSGKYILYMKWAENFVIFGIYVRIFKPKTSITVQLSGCPPVREIWFFFKVREKSGNFVKWSGKLENLQKSGKSQGILKSCLVNPSKN